MKKIKAFVAHSFLPEDRPVISDFRNYLNAFKRLGFEWEDAEDAQSVEISQKVKDCLEDKDVFIGIFTRRTP